MRDHIKVSGCSAESILTIKSVFGWLLCQALIAVSDPVRRLKISVSMQGTVCVTLNQRLGIQKGIYSGIGISDLFGTCVCCLPH